MSAVELLLENPVPICAAGAVLATLCGLAFLSRRNLASLVTLGVVIAATLLLLLVELLVVTEREAVEAALAEIITAIENNQVAAVVAQVDPTSAAVRADVEKLMPMVRVKETGATTIRTELESGATPPVATTRFRGRLRGTHVRTGQQVFYFDEVEITWVRRESGWLLRDFVAYRRGKPIDAVRSLRTNQAVP